LNAIKELREYLKENRSSPASKVLAGLAVALADEREFPLSDLYELPLREFELAMALMHDWRLDRYYAARIRLFDIVLNDVLPDELRTA
jgi:ATP-dependent protease HslVU (ClpYQ) peptidase subunit